MANGAVGADYPHGTPSMSSKAPVRQSLTCRLDAAAMTMHRDLEASITDFRDGQQMQTPSSPWVLTHHSVHNCALVS